MKSPGARVRNFSGLEARSCLSLSDSHDRVDERPGMATRGRGHGQVGRVSMEPSLPKSVTMTIFSVLDRSPRAILTPMATTSEPASDQPGEGTKLLQAVGGDQAAWTQVLAPHRKRLRRMA